ncbi:MAG: T9SS type A sorting domain-containing protein [Bacteroidetes bacterium]|nr:T9SS type A sorting domain-containing protein [Bacteroidota bacterium]
MEFGDITLTSGFSVSAYVVKVDSDGEPVWSIVEASDASVQVFDIILDHENNIIVCGIFYNADAVFSGITLSPNDSYSFVVKYDPNGNIIWAKSGPGEYLSFISLAVDEDNNIIILGSNNGALTFMGEEVEWIGDYDVVYLKYDKNGNEQWLKSLGSVESDSPGEIATDHNGNIFISMVYRTDFSIGAINVTNDGLSDCLILKTTPSGEAIWVKTITGVSDGGNISGIVVDEENDVYLCAELYGDDFLFGMPVNNYGASDVYLVKMNGDDGGLEWYRFGDGSDYDHSASIVLATEGIFISGTFQDAAEFDGLQLYTEHVNAFIVGYERDGDIAQVYPITGNNFVTPIGLDVDGHGNVYCGGYFAENVIVENAEELITSGSNEIFLYKFGSALVDINTVANSGINMDIFPNPAVETITLSFPEVAPILASISIINTSGQIVFESKDFNTVDGKSIDINNLPTGIYSVTIWDNSNILNSQKFVKL